MPDPDPAALQFLATRRSVPAKILTGPVPDRAHLSRLLELAARVPDHGKLEPWRFVVLEAPALDRLATAARVRGTELGLDPETVAKAEDQFRRADLCVVVVSSPVASDKVPEIEQTLSGAAVCLSLVNACLASGWGASWLTGWMAHERAFAAEAFGLEEHEMVLGLIHIGSAATPPPERPRPDMDRIVRWVAA